MNDIIRVVVLCLVHSGVLGRGATFVRLGIPRCEANTSIL